MDLFNYLKKFRLGAVNGFGGPDGKSHMVCGSVELYGVCARARVAHAQAERQAPSGDPNATQPPFERSVDD